MKEIYTLKVEYGKRGSSEFVVKAESKDHAISIARHKLNKLGLSFKSIEVTETVKINPAETKAATLF